MARWPLGQTQRRLLGYLSLQEWKVRLIFWSGALAVGIVAALFAIAGNWAIQLHNRVLAHSPWWSLLLAPVGFVLAVACTRSLFPGTQGSGIPQAIAALRIGDEELRHSVLSLRIAFGKILLTLLGLFSGASIGREGPTVHVGASMLMALGRFTKFPRRYIEHGLILAGGAAGIAAAFNTPIAGIIFAIEEMARVYEERATGTLLVAVILAGITSMAMLGNYTYFGTTGAILPDAHAWLAVLVCGLAGGLAGGLFSRGLIASTHWLAPSLTRRPLVIAAACGLIVAALGLLTHGVTYGTGYEQARLVLVSDAYPDWGFPFYKIAATLASYASGIPGGIFSPSLSTGAGLGADLSFLVPGAPMAAVVILGMVGYFTGVVQTPITAAVIVMEMVNDHSMVIPIMATAFIALGTSKVVCHEPIYWTLAQEFIGAATRDAATQADSSRSSPS